MFVCLSAFLPRAVSVRNKKHPFFFLLSIGGAAGAVSRITGTLGKGIAALTMDDEYQQSRRQNMSKKPTSVKEGLSRGGKGLLEVIKVKIFNYTSLVITEIK